MVVLKCNNIAQYYCFTDLLILLILDQINAALVKIWLTSKVVYVFKMYIIG